MLVGALRLGRPRFAAEEDERDLARPLVRAQRFGELEAVESRHHHVLHDKIRAFRARPLEPAFAVCRFEHPVSLDLQVDRAEHPNRAVVIDDQDTPGLPVAAQTTVSRHEVVVDDPNGRVARRALPTRPPSASSA
jgi:hypothetical protein